jgi:hypothetical protein
MGTGRPTKLDDLTAKRICDAIAAGNTRRCQRTRTSRRQQGLLASNGWKPEAPRLSRVGVVARVELDGVDHGHDPTVRLWKHQLPVVAQDAVHDHPIGHVTARVLGARDGAATVDDELDRNAPSEVRVSAQPLLVALAESTEVGANDPLNDLGSEAPVLFSICRRAATAVREALRSRRRRSGLRGLARRRCRGARRSDFPVIGTARGQHTKQDQHEASHGRDVIRPSGGAR